MSQSEFDRLTQVVNKLRDPQGGCPWDLEQTHQSLTAFLIEEAYEFTQAAEARSDEQMEDEIGDVLLQVLLHATIAKERNSFDLESISKKQADKLIRRHPHVFGEDKEKITPEQVKENWKEIKKEEKKSAGLQHGLPNSLHAFPALLSAAKIGKETERLNFDWDDASQVSYKVEEEWQELKEEITPSVLNKERIEEELGDFLFSTAQLARHLGLNPEEALRKANQKFTKRFNAMAKIVKDENKDMEKMTQVELDHYWSQVKSAERGSNASS